jgi:hypothetical protein
LIAIHFNPVILFNKYFITFVFFRFNVIQRELRLRRGWEKWQDIETAGSSNLGLFKHIPRHISQKLFTCQHAAFQSWSLIQKNGTMVCTMASREILPRWKLLWLVNTDTRKCIWSCRTSTRRPSTRPVIHNRKVSLFFQFSNEQVEIPYSECLWW